MKTKETILEEQVFILTDALQNIIESICDNPQTSVYEMAVKALKDSDKVVGDSIKKQISDSLKKIVESTHDNIQNSIGKMSMKDIKDYNKVISSVKNQLDVDGFFNNVKIICDDYKNKMTNGEI